MNQNYLYDMYNQNYMIPAVDMIYSQNNFNNKMNNIFVNSKEGFLRGNMENGTYVPYKNYTYINPNITNERQKMLYQIQELCFAAHDANLYLDTHPNDANMISLYKEYNKRSNDLTLDYERKYGPICLSDNEGIKNNSWNWIDKPWPWEK